MIRAVIISPLMLAACNAQDSSAVTQFKPDYRGVETSLLEGDLVQFDVTMTGARDSSDLDA
ncbi:MAG: hypothetical protein ACI8R4_003522, partial [Paracoccaceae bacterium]